jgi:putative addiction module CopG family antidote
MAKTYTPGPEADAIVDQLLAKGCYRSADEVVRVGLQLLEQSEAEIEELRRLIEEGDAAYPRGGYTASGKPDPWGGKQP